MKIKFSLMAVLLMSTYGFAGGDMTTVDAVEPVVVVPVIEEDHSSFYIGAAVAYQRTYATTSKWFGVTDTQDTTGALGLIAGYNFNEYIAIEGRFAGSVFDEDYAEVTTYSVFVKPQYPVSEDFSIYGLLGYGNVNVKATDAGGLEFGAVPSIVGNTLMDESGFQWGLGLSYAVTEEFDIFFDYVSFAKDADIMPTPLYNYNGAGVGTNYDVMSNDALTLGTTYKF